MKKLIKILLAGILTVVTAVMLIACAPADLAKAEEKMEEKGYNVTVSSNELGLINNCDGWISINDSEGILDIDYDTLTAYLFKDSDAAKEYFNNREFDENDTVWIMGKWVVIGDEDIYKDFIA